MPNPPPGLSSLQLEPERMRATPPQGRRLSRIVAWYGPSSKICEPMCACSPTSCSPSARVDRLGRRRAPRRSRCSARTWCPARPVWMCACVCASTPGATRSSTAARAPVRAPAAPAARPLRGCRPPPRPRPPRAPCQLVLGLVVAVEVDALHGKAARRAVYSSPPETTSRPSPPRPGPEQPRRAVRLARVTDQRLARGTPPSARLGRRARGCGSSPRRTRTAACRTRWPVERRRSRRWPGGPSSVIVPPSPAAARAALRAPCAMAPATSPLAARSGARDRSADCCAARARGPCGESPSTCSESARCAWPAG